MDKELAIKTGIMETVNHECYVSLEVAKLLKDAGFDWEVDTSYVRDYGDMDDDAEYIPLDTFYFGEMGVRNWNREGISVCQSGKHRGLLNRVSGPTLAVAQRWLREVKNIALYVCPSYEPVRFVAPNVVADDEKWVMKWQVLVTHYDIEADEIDFGDAEEEIFDTYEEAQEAGIKKALEIILEKGE